MVLASDPVFRKVYEVLERHDDRVTIVTTKSHDALLCPQFALMLQQTLLM